MAEWLSNGGQSGVGDGSNSGGIIDHNNNKNKNKTENEKKNPFYTTNMPPSVQFV